MAHYDAEKLLKKYGFYLERSTKTGEFWCDSFKNRICVANVLKGRAFRNFESKLNQLVKGRPQPVIPVILSAAGRDQEMQKREKRDEMAAATMTVPLGEAAQGGQRKLVIPAKSNPYQHGAPLGKWTAVAKPVKKIEPIKAPEPAKPEDDGDEPGRICFESGGLLYEIWGRIAQMSLQGLSNTAIREQLIQEGYRDKLGRKPGGKFVSSFLTCARRKVGHAWIVMHWAQHGTPIPKERPTMRRGIQSLIRKQAQKSLPAPQSPPKPEVAPKPLPVQETPPVARESAPAVVSTRIPHGVLAILTDPAAPQARKLAMLRAWKTTDATLKAILSDPNLDPESVIGMLAAYGEE